MKKKLKRFGIFLIFAIPICYFIFTILFFSPFEDAYGRIDYLIPRKVDLFMCKKGLKNDFVEFPIPAFFSEVEFSREWRVFSETPLYKDLEKQIDLRTKIEELSTALKQIPLFDVLEDVLGEELIVAGNFKSQGPQPVSGLAFFRASWKIKLAFELFLWDMVRGWSGAPELEGSTVFRNPEGYYTLTMADNTEFYMKRSADLIVAGDDEALMLEVCDLYSLGDSAIDNSLGGSKGYIEKVSMKERRDTNYLDFHTDMSKVFLLSDWDDAWKANDTDFSVMVAMEVFNPEFFKSITGAVKFDKYLDINSKIDLDTGNVEEAKTGFFSFDSFQAEEKLSFIASMCPDDVFFAGCAKLDLEQILKIMERSMGQDLHTTVSNMISQGRQFNHQFNITAIWDLKFPATISSSPSTSSSSI